METNFLRWQYLRMSTSHIDISAECFVICIRLGYSFAHDLLEQRIAINLSKGSLIYLLIQQYFIFLMVDLLLQGRVTIAAKPGMKLEIPDGVVIENKVGHFNLFILFASVISHIF